jgi:hypothetical protein
LSRQFDSSGNNGSNVTETTDMLKHANRRKRDRTLALRFTGSPVHLRDHSYQFLTWDAPLRWIKLFTWLLVIVFSLWDIAKTFGRHIGHLS